MCTYVRVYTDVLHFSYISRLLIVINTKFTFVTDSLPPLATTTMGADVFERRVLVPYYLFRTPFTFLKSMLPTTLCMWVKLNVVFLHRCRNAQILCP